jgi:hypothetical protein
MGSAVTARSGNQSWGWPASTVDGSANFCRPPALTIVRRPAWLCQPGRRSAPALFGRDLVALRVGILLNRLGERHRRKWRSTNLPERSLGEVRRLTRGDRPIPGEHSCL